MMEYKRLTDNKTAKSMKKYGNLINPYYVRLAELEEKIEQGTLKEIPKNVMVLTNDEFWTLSNAFSKKKTHKEIAKEIFTELLKDENLENIYFTDENGNVRNRRTIRIEKIKDLAEKYGVEAE